MNGSMKAAIDETNRRRTIQRAYNEEHGIVPTTVKKEIRELISIGTSEDGGKKGKKGRGRGGVSLDRAAMDEIRTVEDRDRLLESLRAEMRTAAKELRFEEAAYLRDRIKEIEVKKVE